MIGRHLNSLCTRKMRPDGKFDSGLVEPADQCHLPGLYAFLRSMGAPLCSLMCVLPMAGGGGGGQTGYEYWATTYPLSIGRTLGWPLVTSSRLGWDIHDVGGELVGQLVDKIGKSWELFLLH